MRSLKLEWKLHFTYAYLVPVIVIAGVLLNLYTEAQSPFSPPTIAKLHMIAEVLMPLVLSMGLAVLIPYERDEGMMEMRLSYAQPFELSMLRKISLPVCYWLIMVLGSGLWAYHYYLPYRVWDMLLVIIPPSIFLGGLTFLTSALTLSSALSMMVPLGWWAWDLLTSGLKSGVFALMPYTLHNTQISLSLNRTVLILAGLMLFAAGLSLVRRQGTRI